MPVRLAINGFGLIGRCLAERVRSCSFVELVAINDVVLPASEDRAAFGDKVAWSSIADPAELRWHERGVDVVVEAARFFKRDELEVQGDGTRILMTGDLRDGEPDLTLVPTINGHLLQSTHRIICLGSDRAQCLLPLFYCLDAAFSLEEANVLLVRPPYVGNPWGLRFTDADRQRARAQFARVDAALGVKIHMVRVEDPNATHVHFTADVQLAAIPDEDELATVLTLDSYRGPRLLEVVNTLDEGTPTACRVLRSRMHMRRKRVWLEGAYDPIAGYVERVLDCLAIFA